MSEAPTGPSAADLEALAGYAAALADGIAAAVGPWVERSVTSVCDRQGQLVTGILRQHAAEAGARAGLAGDQSTDRASTRSVSFWRYHAVCHWNDRLQLTD